jgi:hypothetical protein
MIYLIALFLQLEHNLGHGFLFLLFSLHVEIIGSTNLIILLEDEVFTDFFNTFLSLPVSILRLKSNILLIA